MDQENTHVNPRKVVESCKESWTTPRKYLVNNNFLEDSVVVRFLDQKRQALSTISLAIKKPEFASKLPNTIGILSDSEKTLRTDSISLAF